MSAGIPTMAEDNKAFSVVMYFALNPGAALTTSEISERFNLRRSNVKCNLRTAIVNGLVKVAPPPPGARVNTYTAGEALRKMRARLTETA